ncbi:DUF2130 domain-containing protein [Aurantibacillus circumpalustris]|uniref:DUF2130 domain-containing protein n=1 Tax=Aurantibacillus circumpalustris TaxID=3036359 RepID=UPI00295BC0EA|nr:DUF2130 domain-containing protein [Aurantibacillus circumpalustris]
MKTSIKCPSCGNKIPDTLVHQFQIEIRTELEKEYSKKESAFQKEISSQQKELFHFNKIKDQVEQEFTLKIKEREKIILDLKNKMDEAKKRAESAFTSQQNSGEAQELLLEEMLQDTFPTDEIIEVKKGQRGADCIQVIKTTSGLEIGKIIYESKNTKTFSEGWITKLKEDNLLAKADVLILVTQAMPKESDGRFFIQDGVWICKYVDAKELAIVLRYGLLKMQSFLLTQKDKDDKKERLFEYLTSNNFRNSFESILDGFRTLQQTHNQEKLKMAMLWKEREKALEQVLTQSIEFYGSLKGIAGVASFPELQTLESLPKAS